MNQTKGFLMNRLIKLLIAVALSGFSAPTFAANLPLSAGPQDPSQIQATLNQLILGINSGVDGLLGSTPGTPATTLTTIQPLATYTLPGGLLASGGQGIHIHCWGVNSADANAKTLTYSFGGSTLALIVTGSGNTWQSDFYVYKTGASAQTAEAHAATGTTNVASAQGAWTVTDTSAITVLIEGTAETSGTMTLNGSYIEQIK